jgi:putative peptide zinc metalloprotease protein
VTTATTALPAHEPADPAPRLAPGTVLLGELEGSGFAEPHYLVVRFDGQVLHVSRLLFLVAERLDGRDSDAVADEVSELYGRRLSVEGLSFLVDQRLQPMGLVADPHVPPGAAARGAAAAAAPAAPPRSDLVLALRFRGTLVQPRTTRVVARALSPLFHPVVVALALTVLVAGDVWLVRTATLSQATAAVLQAPVLVLALLGLLLLSTLFHEFGHAAACHRGGARPGGIGVALYVVYPAFFTDVTQSYRLGRTGRLRTDLGGVYFNALTVLALTALYAGTGWPVLVLAVLVVHAELLQQLMPVARLDGYYVVADLVGVPDLFGRVRPILASLLPGRQPGPRVRELRRSARVVVTAWVLVAVPVMAGAFVALVWAAPATTRSVWRAEQDQWHLLVASVSAVDPPGALLAALSMALLPLPLVGLALVLATLARRLAHQALSRWGHHTPHGSRQAGHQPQEVTMSGSKPAPVLPMMEAAHGPTGTTPSPSGSADLAAPAASTGITAREAVIAPSAADFTEEAMLRPRSRPPARGWRRGVYAATRGGVNLGPGTAERREMDLLGRVRTPVRGCRRIVVISRKGGAGKTTTTLMLGHTLATHRGDRVVALDANPDAGSLAHRMRRETTSTVKDLLEEREWISRYADMRGFTSQAADTRLEVVASDDDPRITSALGEQDYRRAIEVLDRHYNLVLVDTGTGILDSAIQGILAEADQLVVVMPPALDGARVAAMTLDWLQEHGYADLVRGAVAVVNSVHADRGQLELARIEEHFEQRCGSVVRIPWDPVLQAGAHTALDDLHQRTRDAYLQLASAVAGSFGDQHSSARGPRQAAR